MAHPPFKVKAIYAYSSEHADDLNFPDGTVITVTEEEDADWYVGEYVAADGEQKSGLFPKNFVEKFEPAAPPRPTRAARPKAAEAPIAANEPAPVTAKEEEAPKRESIDAPASAATPEPAAASNAQASKPAPAPAPSEAKSQPPPAPKPEPAAPAAQAEPPVKATEPSKKAPPPVAEKSSSFKDRLAAFNKQGAAPVAPFKPGGSSANTFIKKPFVAPPPSRHAYIPPVQKQEPVKVYRREEDPEIAQRQAEDEEAAEKAGLTTASHADPTAAVEGDEDAPKPVSLKERIALLQKQQQEQAAKRADASTKKKPERPPKKRVESHDGLEDARTSIDQPEERTTRDSSDIPREVPAPTARKSSRPPAVPREREVSDGNEADQSAADSLTEGDAAAESDTEDESSARQKQQPARHPVVPSKEPDVVEEQDAPEEDDQEAEEEEDEDEVDEETRRQMALRERMAKLSGGMGMGAMFGPPGGMAMPGMGGAPKKKKPAAPVEHEESEDIPAARAPMVPIPGMGLPGMAMQRSISTESEMTVGKEKEDERHPITAHRSPEEVPDVEDVEVASPKGRAAPPPPPADRAVPQPPPSDQRGAPPPVPGGRPSTDSRPPPPQPPPQQMDESEGSEADDEIVDSSTAELPSRGPPPPLPSATRPPQNRMSMDSPTLPLSPISPTDGQNKRASRVPPPIPGAASPPPVPIASPTMAPAAPAAGRAPPPPPPTAAPPTRQGTTDSLHRRVMSGAQQNEEGSEYEGDYDTDIASGEKHRDALKAPHGHARESSFDDASLDTPVKGRPGVPPLPPGRKSVDHARGPPPPVPVSHGDDDYDPFNYASTPSASAARSPPPVPAGAQRLPPLPPTAAPAMPAPPPVPTRPQDEESEDDEDEDDLYSQPQPPQRRSTEQAPPRKSMDRPPPPIPPQDRAPPPLPPQAPPSHAHFEAPPAPPRDRAPGRPSMEQERSFGPPSRVSTEPLGRPSMSGQRPVATDGDFIARDVDLGENSQWWAQPNTPPPALQGRSDVGFEVEESSNSKRGGKTIVSKDVYVVYQDYSQTFVSARFDAANPGDVQLEQRHEPPPGRLRQDQLENWWTRYGASIAKSVERLSGSTAIGDGSAPSLISELLKPLPGALAPVGTRAYGALVYANLGNATVQQYDEIRAGDIVTFRNAKFQGKHGGLHTKYSLDVAGHVGVVVEWDGTKKKVRVAEQGRDGGKEKKGKKGKVEVEGYRLEDLRSGEVRVWRVVGREFVGWDKAS